MPIEETAAVAIAYPDSRRLEGITVLNMTLPHHLGEMLINHYRDRMKIWQLVQNGDMLSVGAELGPQVGLEAYSEDNYDEFRILVELRCVISSGAAAPPRQYADRREWGWENLWQHRYLYDPRIGETGTWLYAEPGLCPKPDEHRPTTLMPLCWSTERWKRRQRMARTAAARV